MRCRSRLSLVFAIPCITCALALSLSALTPPIAAEGNATQPAATQPAATQAASRPAAGVTPYVDPSYGFTIVPPRFSDGNARGLVVNFHAPPQNGYSANISVIVDTARTNRRDYVEISRRNLLRNTDAKINSITERDCHGFDAEVLDYEATMAVRKLRFLQLIVITEDQVYLVTCTASADTFDQYKENFQQAIDSFVPPSAVAK